MVSNRREFIQWMAASGVLGSAALLAPRLAHAQASPYGGKILIDVVADGGMDQSSWTDPRETDRTINNWVGTPAVVAGNLRVAPMGNNASFFQKYYKQMLVINGVNSLNANHGEGLRVQATGVDGPGMIGLAELFADRYGNGLPLPWLGVGRSFSTGLKGMTYFPAFADFRAMAQPNVLAQSTGSLAYIKEGDLQKVQAARMARLARAQAQGTPRANALGAQFAAADASRALLANLSDFIPTTFTAADTRFAQAHAGLVAARAGIVSAMQLGVSDFDAHTQHDAAHNRQLTLLTDMVDYVWQKAAELGIAQRVFLRIYTEFGRTLLNNNGGKDHWAPGGTVVLMEANPTWGNRVVGATNAKHRSVKINPSTGAIDPVNGVVITPAHVLSALRTYLGAETTNTRFDLKVPANERFDFFNPALSTGYPYL